MCYFIELSFGTFGNQCTCRYPPLLFVGMCATSCGNLAFVLRSRLVGWAWPAPGGGLNGPCAAISLRARFGTGRREAEEQCYLPVWASALTQQCV